jgi:hypothetical protein
LRVQRKVDDAEDYLGSVLIDWGAHAIGVYMRPVMDVVFLFVVDECRGILNFLLAIASFSSLKKYRPYHPTNQNQNIGRTTHILILHQPSPPKIINTLLIARTPRNPQCVQIHRPLNNIRRHRLLPIQHYTISLQQNILQQIILIVLRLNDLFRNHFTSNSSYIMKLCIPELDHGLFLEPSFVHEESVDDAGAIILFACFFGCVDDFFGDDCGVGFGDGLGF